MDLLDELEALVKVGLEGDDAAWQLALAAFKARYAPRRDSNGGLQLEESGGARSLRVIAGEGMLTATADGAYTDAYGRHEIKAGITRVAPDHPLARQRPEAFRVAWREDVETATQHRNNLRARMAELRGEEQAPQVTAGEKPDWYIG